MFGCYDRTEQFRTFSEFPLATSEDTVNMGARQLTDNSEINFKGSSSFGIIDRILTTTINSQTCCACREFAGKSKFDIWKFNVKTTCTSPPVPSPLLDLATEREGRGLYSWPLGLYPRELGGEGRCW